MLIVAGLHAIELANNPWSCDCRLRPLKHWLVTNNVPHSADPQCHSPPRLAGQPFANLQVDEFACPPELLSAPRYVEANAGKVSYETVKSYVYSHGTLFISISFGKIVPDSPR